MLRFGPAVVTADALGAYLNELLHGNDRLTVELTVKLLLDTQRVKPTMPMQKPAFFKINTKE